jgi:hypothetical protein
LAWTGNQLSLERVERRRLRWRRDGLGLAGELRTGDEVSVHWDWVCERLHPEAATRLERRLQARLRSVRC